MEKQLPVRSKIASCQANVRVADSALKTKLIKSCRYLSSPDPTHGSSQVRSLIAPQTRRKQAVGRSVGGKRLASASNDCATAESEAWAESVVKKKVAEIIREIYQTKLNHRIAPSLARRPPPAVPPHRQSQCSPSNFPTIPPRILQPLIPASTPRQAI